MIVSWMLYAGVVALLVAVAAAALESVVAPRGWPLRGIWLGALLASLLLPWAVRAVASPPAAQVEVAHAAPVPPVHSPVVPWTSPAGSMSRADAAPATAFDLDRWLLRGWGAGSLSIALALALSYGVLRRQRRAWSPRIVEGRIVWVSADVGPAVMGLFPSRIVVPEHVLEWEPGERALMLAHEEEHIRAGDPWLLWGTLLFCVAFPWNLPLWWQWRRLRQAVEMDCDARVLAQGSERHAYTRLLLKVGEWGTAHRLAVAALPESPVMLERRIRRMLAPPSRSWGVRAAASASLASGALLGACALKQPVSTPQLLGNTTRFPEAANATRNGSATTSTLSSNTSTVTVGVGAPQPRPHQPRGWGGSAGDILFRPDVKAFYSTEVKGDSGKIEVLVVGRLGKQQRPSGPLRPHPPVLPGASRMLAYYSMDTLYYTFDKATRDLWIHRRKVPLGDANVVLIEHANAQGGTPTIIGTFRIDPDFRIESGFDSENFVERIEATKAAVQARLEAIPAVRTFLQAPSAAPIQDRRPVARFAGSDAQERVAPEALAYCRERATGGQRAHLVTALDSIDLEVWGRGDTVLIAGAVEWRNGNGKPVRGRWFCDMIRSESGTWRQWHFGLAPAG